MARADVYTLLPLDIYAQIMGLNPLHFNGGRLPGITQEPFTITAASDWSERPIWHQFGWQHTKNISRDVLARTIQQAEFDVARFLGYWPAPAWTSQEVHTYPRPYRPEFYGSWGNVRGQFKEIKTKFAKVIAAGQRVVGDAVVATQGVELIYSDPNTDLWNTLATITVTTDITNECEVKLYFAGRNGSPLWEIRPLKSVSIVGNTLTITVDSWLMFEPSVVEAIPTQEITAINAGLDASYAQTVEVRREYTDHTQPSAQFFWEREPGQVFPPPFCCTACGGTGCETCSLVTQNGCFDIRNAEDGVIAAKPATYDSDDARWERATSAVCREPDEVKIWYQSGLQSEFGLRGDCNKLDSALARTIAMLATARLTCRFRAGTSLSSMVDYWRRDQAESTAEGSTIFTPPDILSNPFGTRRGEVEAYRTLFNMRERKVKVGAVAA